MGRRSLAEAFYDRYEEDKSPWHWLAVYDFKRDEPNIRFWGNLKRLKGLLCGTLL